MFNKKDLSSRIEQKSCLGFTLVELLVVISIIALLLSILLPSLNKAREMGKRVVCGGNMRQVGLAIRCYGNDYKGKLPFCHYINYPYSGPVKAKETYPKSGVYTQSLGASIWPYLKDKKYYYCPNTYTPLIPGWMGGTNCDIGYFYFGNISTKLYPNFPNAPSDNSTRPELLLMQDLLVWIQTFNSYAYSAHTPTKQEGGNGLYADGHVSWIPISKMSSKWIDPAGNKVGILYKWPIGR